MPDFTSVRLEVDPIALATNGPDRGRRIELFAKAPDENFDDVAVAVEILLVKMLGQLGF